MTNFEIIANDSINNGIFTEEQVKEMIAKIGFIPLFTFAEWKKRGYSVKKGEHAKMISFIWKMKKSKEETKDDENIEDDAKDFYKVKAFLFGLDQVEKITA